MFAKTLHSLLIATILACPAVCGKGVCRGADTCEASPESNDCNTPCKQDSCPNDRSDEPPSQPIGVPCENCQCICFGATVEEAPQVLPLLTMVYPFDLWIVVNPLNSSPLSCPVLAEPSSDDGNIKSGRVICSLHMSFLC